MVLFIFCVNIHCISNEIDKNEYIKRLEELKKDERFFEMKSIRHHYHSTTYMHSCLVADACLKKALKSKKKYNIDDIILGAMLHDFYLYDHNVKKYHKKHLLRHPRISLKNAKQYFSINKNVSNIISAHMWPLTIFSIPKSKEAWLVCFMDKYISIKEAFKLHKK